MPSTPDQFLELINQRRMVRAFTPAPVGTPVVDALVAAAHAGPSAGNTRALDVLVLLGEDTALYWDTTLPEEKRTSFPWPMLLNAPALLLPYVDPHAYVDRYSEPDKARTGLGEGEDRWPVPYWWVDGGAAVENVLLAAEALGLGACFFGQFDHEPAVRSRFGVPETRRAIGTIAIGHPDLASDRRSQSTKRATRAASERTHHGHWQDL